MIRQLVTLFFSYKKYTTIVIAGVEQQDKSRMLTQVFQPVGSTASRMHHLSGPSCVRPLNQVFSRSQVSHALQQLR